MNFGLAVLVARAELFMTMMILEMLSLNVGNGYRQSDVPACLKGLCFF